MSKEGHSASSLTAQLNNMEIGTNQKGSSPVVPEAAKDKTVTILEKNNMSASDITSITYPQEFAYLHKPYPETETDFINEQLVKHGMSEMFGLGDDNNNKSRPSERIMNSLYDPKFEEMGLPIDPHIRLMRLQEQGKDSVEKYFFI